MRSLLLIMLAVPLLALVGCDKRINEANRGQPPTNEHEWNTNEGASAQATAGQ